MAKNNDDREVLAKDLAKIAKLTYHTVDHWSSEKLLVFRRVGRTRFFPLKENLDRIGKIQALQQEGVSIPGIQRELSRSSR